MTRIARRSPLAAVVLAALLATPLWGAPQEAAAQAALEIPMYVPPQIGVPGGRLGGGTRGATALPRVEVLAPSDHVALTTSQEPTLYWWSSGDSDVRVDFAISDEEGVKPLVEATLRGPVRKGIHALALSDHGARLEPGRTYTWSISLVPDADRRSNDVIASAPLRVQAPSDALRKRLEKASGREVFVYAEGGLWYDALAAASRALEAAPGDAAVREQRAALLDQVGLTRVSDAERSGG